jgi:hypothetical protein
MLMSPFVGNCPMNSRGHLSSLDALSREFIKGIPESALVLMSPFRGNFP